MRASRPHCAFVPFIVFSLPSVLFYLTLSSAHCVAFIPFNLNRAFLVMGPCMSGGIRWWTEGLNDCPQTLCKSLDMHESKWILCKFLVSSISDLTFTVSRSVAWSPWVSSLPVRATGFWCPWSFVVGVLCVDLGVCLLCVCYVSSVSRDCTCTFSVL
jgi:hypothetical protein